MSADRLRRKLRFAVIAWRIWAFCCGLLLSTAAVAALYLASMQYRIGMADWLERAMLDRAAVDQIVRLAPIFNGLLTFAGILSFIYWLRWIYVSAQLVRKAEPDRMRYSPIVAVFGFLVPIAHFWMPVYTMVDIEDFAAEARGARASDVPLRPGAIIMLALLATSVIAVVFAFPIDDFTTPLLGQRVMTAVAMASVAALGIVVLADGFIRDVSEGQAIALKRLMDLEDAKDAET